MATNNTRDVKLNIAVGTTGAKDLANNNFPSFPRRRESSVTG